MKTNKTNTATASFTFDFTPCDGAMVSHYNSGITLSDAVTLVWNKAPAAERQIKPFRDQFTTRYLKLKYSETHIRRVLASFDFLQLRKRTGKANATKAAKKAKANPDKVRSVDSFVSEIKGRKFNKAELVKLIAALATL